MWSKAVDEVEDYFRGKEYPDDMDKSNYGYKSNFRGEASTFTIRN